MGVVTVAYDLAKSPPTHDFLNFLWRAEHRRVEQGADALDIIIMPGTRLWSDRDKFYGPERRDWKIYDLLMQLARLNPWVRNVIVGDGVQDLSYMNPGGVAEPFLRAPATARTVMAGAMLKNVVTFTIRQSEFEKPRNSNISEWEKVGDWLANVGFTPVFIPDAEADMRGKHAVTRHAEYPGASYNMALRLALYERAKVNVLNNGGPLLTLLYSHSPMLCFKMHVSEVACCSKEHLIQSGFSPEHDWSTPTLKRRMYWEPDTAKIMIPALAEYLGRTA